MTGLGMAGLRDTVSFLRYAPRRGQQPRRDDQALDRLGNMVRTGRFLRDFLLAGANVDEAGQPAFDGLFVQIAGARRGK